MNMVACNIPRARTNAVEDLAGLGVAVIVIFLNCEYSEVECGCDCLVGPTP